MPVAVFTAKAMANAVAMATVVAMAIAMAFTLSHGTNHNFSAVLLTSQPSLSSPLFPSPQHKPMSATLLTSQL